MRLDAVVVGVEYGAAPPTPEDTALVAEPEKTSLVEPRLEPAEDAGAGKDVSGVLKLY